MKKSILIGMALALSSILLLGCSSHGQKMEPITVEVYTNSDYVIPDIETILIETDGVERPLTIAMGVSFVNYPMSVAEAEEDIYAMNPELNGWPSNKSLKAGTIIKVKNYDYGKTEEKTANVTTEANEAKESNVSTEKEAVSSSVDTNKNVEIANNNKSDETQITIPEEYWGTWVATKNGTSKYIFSKDNYSYCPTNSKVTSGTIERIEKEENGNLIFYPNNVAHGFTVVPGVKGDGLITIDGYEYKNE